MSRPSKPTACAPKPWAPKRKASGLELECERPAKTVRTQDEMPGWRDFVDSLPPQQHVQLLSRVIDEAIKAPGPAREHTLLQLSLHSDHWTVMQWYKAATTHYHKKASSETKKTRALGSTRLRELVAVAPAQLFSWARFPDIMWSISTWELLDKLATSWLKEGQVWLREPLLAHTESYASRVMEKVSHKIELLRWILGVEAERKLQFPGLSDLRLEAKGLCLVFKRPSDQADQRIGFNAGGYLRGVGLDTDAVEKRRFMHRLGTWLAGAQVAVEVRSPSFYESNKLKQHAFTFDQEQGLCLRPVDSDSSVVKKWEAAPRGKKVTFGSEHGYGSEFTVSWSMLETISDVVALVFAHLDATLHALELPRVIRDEVVGYLARGSHRRDVDWPQPRTEVKAWLKNSLGGVLVDETDIRALLERLVGAKNVHEQQTILGQLKK